MKIYVYTLNVFFLNPICINFRFIIASYLLLSSSSDEFFTQLQSSSFQRFQTRSGFHYQRLFVTIFICISFSMKVIQFFNVLISYFSGGCDFSVFPTMMNKFCLFQTYLMRMVYSYYKSLTDSQKPDYSPKSVTLLTSNNDYHEWSYHTHGTERYEKRWKHPINCYYYWKYEVNFIFISHFYLLQILLFTLIHSMILIIRVSLWNNMIVIFIIVITLIELFLSINVYFFKLVNQFSISTYIAIKYFSVTSDSFIQQK